MRLPLIFVVLAASASFLVGCSSDDPPAFNSKEALQVAPSIHYGCQYTWHTSSSYGTSSSSDDRPMCEENRRCDEAMASSDTGYGFGGGAEYNSYSYAKDGTNFIGTCADHKDIGTGESKCTIAPAICLADPNCLAMRDCVLKCADNDDACTKSCVENGDYNARENLLASAECVGDGSDNAPLRQLFSAPAE